MSEPVTNIVLVGRTGNGKSATGNSLLGQAKFLSELQPTGVTMKCEMYRAAIEDGPIINVIDTPGLFDLSVSADYASKEIINCLTMAEGGIHALLFVLSARNRITQEEESTLNTLQFIFKSKFFNYMIVVFTGGDELEWKKQTLDDYLREGCPDFLTRALQLSSGRMVLFDNKTNDRGKKTRQLNQLLAHVADIGDNNGKPYTDKMHRQIKDEQAKFESEKFAAKAAAIRKSLKLKHEEKLRRMAQILEQRLIESSEAYERAMYELRYTQHIRPPQYYSTYHPSPQQNIMPPQYFPPYHPSPQVNIRPQYFPPYHPAPQQRTSPPQYFPSYHPSPQQSRRYPQNYHPVPQMRPLAPQEECNIM